jgi:hypothetical protein
MQDFDSRISKFSEDANQSGTPPPPKKKYLNYFLLFKKAIHLFSKKLVKTLLVGFL